MSEAEAAEEGASPSLATGDAVARRLFAQFDKDGNGLLDRNELSSLFQALGYEYSNEALDAFMKVK